MFIISKNIAILGLGKENQALLAWLFKHNYQGNITICDQRKKTELKKIIQAKKELNKYLPTLNWRLEEQFNQNLEDFELLLRSPGWPIHCPGVQKALKHGSLLSSAMEFFLASCPSTNIIGVTGSKGKGTTASLITAILKQDKRRVFIGGNIGIAPFEFFDQIKTNDWIVLELSSFQLEDLKISPRYSVLTNIFKEHLSPADPYNPNYHKSYASYIKAKLQIAINPQNKVLIANDKLKSKLEKQKLNTKIIYFKASNLNSKLQGIYNQENIGAAIELSKVLKIKKEIYSTAIAKFSNLEHRLELVIEKNGIKYYNNSFATTPESTILDLISFKNPIILIAGGADKGADFKALAKVIKSKVKHLIILNGQASPRLLKNVIDNNYQTSKISPASSMKTAIKIANSKAQSGDIVLLSTACASFGLFKNYKERGEQFRYYVKK